MHVELFVYIGLNQKSACMQGAAGLLTMLWAIRDCQRACIVCASVQPRKQDLIIAEHYRCEPASL